MAVLEVLSQDLAGRAFSIDQQRFTIGRHSDNDLVLPRRFISRHHAEILSRGNRFIVRGLSAKNPLIHRNEEKSSFELKHGEVFEICGVRFRFDGAQTARSGKADNVRFSGSQPGMVAAAAPPPPQQEDGFDSFENDDWGDSDGWSTETDGPTDGFNDDFGDGGFDDDGFGTPVEPVDDFGAAKGKDSVQLSGLGAGDEDWMNEPAAAEASHERFVFGAEDENDAFVDDEKTEVVSLNDSNEQTGQIDLLNIDANLDDPFAESTQNDEQEVVFKALIFICLAALVVAAFILFWTVQPAKPVQRAETVYEVNPGEVKQVEFRFTSDDKPDALLANGQWRPINLYNAILELQNDQFVRVYWVLPYKYNSYGYLLIEGKAINPSGSVYTLRFAQKGDWRSYRVKVSGKSKKEEARRIFLENVIKKTKNQIKQEIRKLLGQGDALWAERENGFPGNYKLALNQYEQALIAYEALAKKVGTTFDPDIKKFNTVVTTKIATAKREWNEKIKQQEASYESRTKLKGSTAQRAREIRKLLKIIQDKDSLKYKIYDMLLKAL